MKESKWAYFKSMEFLKDQFQKRDLQGNVSSQLTFDEENENLTTNLSPDSPENEPQSERESPSSPQSRNPTNESMPPQKITAPPKKITKMNNTAVFKKLVNLEEQKIHMFKERNSTSRNEDPDYHFLMSLLPYLRKVPEERKMIVRTKLQQVFCEEDFSARRFGDGRTLQPIDHPIRNYSVSACGSSTSDSWTSGSPARTPLSTPQHEDLASFFSNVTSDNIN